MAKLDTYTFTSEDLTEEINKAKELFLHKMVNEGFISDDQAKEMSKYSVIATKPSVLGQLFKKDGDQLKLKTVKVLKDTDEENNSETEKEK